MTIVCMKASRMTQARIALSRITMIRMTLDLATLSRKMTEMITLDGTELHIQFTFLMNVTPLRVILPSVILLNVVASIVTIDTIYKKI